MRLIPSRKFILFLLLPAPVLLVFPVTTALAAVMAYDVALLIILLLDFLVVPSPSQFEVRRSVPPTLSLGRDNEILWHLLNHSRRTISFQITEDLPGELTCDLPVMSGRIAAQSVAGITRRIRPCKRGLFEFGNISIRCLSPLGLSEKQTCLHARDTVKVYPDATHLVRYEVALQRHRLLSFGLTTTRDRGRGGLYESLRDYVPGDDPCDIAWKATARRGRMITRNYEADRSQNILILLDCGRLMATETGKMQRLDYAINASLLLTYTAMKQGDQVGLVAFSDRIESYVPPTKGRTALPRVTEALYRLEARLVEPDYGMACRFLALQHRKRSLIVILTDLLDSYSSSVLLAYSARFARKHLPICVTLKNQELQALVDEAPANTDDCFSKAVGIGLLNERSLALKKMRDSGVDVLETDPETLSPKLIEHYLWLKRNRRF